MKEIAELKAAKTEDQEVCATCHVSVTTMLSNQQFYLN